MNAQVKKSMEVFEALSKSQLDEMQKMSPSELEELYHAVDYEAKNPASAFHQLAAEFTVKCALAVMEFRKEGDGQR